MKNRLSLKAQSNNKAHQNEIVQLAGQECLAAFADTDRSLLNAALDYASGPATRVWAMTQGNRLLAVAGWRFLPWDTEILGWPSGSVGGLWAEGDYAEQCHRLETVLKACIGDAEGHGVRFLSVRLPEGGLAALHAVEAVGFRIIESFLTFGRKTIGEIVFDGESKDTFDVRLAQPDEMETVASIAYCAFQSFRLRADPQIPDARARHSRREWVRNGFQGRAEAIYVAESENRIVGFVLLRSKTVADETDDTECRLITGRPPPRESMNPCSPGSKTGEIELIAVEPGFHGKGIGKALVAAAIRHYQGKVSEIQVGTQAKNLQAVGLYTRMGFSVVRSEFSFHRHAETSA